jgi:hypothetical protein
MLPKRPSRDGQSENWSLGNERSRRSIYRDVVCADMTHKESAMLDLVRELILFLLQDRLTVGEVARRVGPIGHDPGIPLSIELQPVLPGVRAAKLARFPDSGLPYVLTLEPAMESRPIVGALKEVLGPYKQARTGLEMPASLIFPPAGRESGWQVVVFVTLDKVGVEMDSARTRTIAFRRDPPPEQPVSAKAVKMKRGNARRRRS